jgi:hypothetical protein
LVPDFARWTPPVGDAGEASDRRVVVQRAGDGGEARPDSVGCAAERQEGRSDAEHRNEETGAVVECAAERQEGRSDAEHRNEETGAIVECAAERQEGRSDAEHRNEEGERTAGGDVPLMVTGTGERARFQNELPQAQGGLQRSEDGTAEDGSEERRDSLACAAERQHGRSDAGHRDDDNGNLVVPLMLTETREGTRSQNELAGGESDVKDRGRRAEDGSVGSRDVDQRAAARLEGRSEATHRNGRGEDLAPSCLLDDRPPPDPPPE